MDIKEGELYAAAYGETFEIALTQKGLEALAIEEQKGKGFNSAEECANWAAEHHLDLLVMSKSQHKLLSVSQFGELLALSDWKRYYSVNVLYWLRENKRGDKEPVHWYPSGYEYGKEARVPGEKSDGVRAPLYHRDYFTPTGSFDPVKGTFNVAKPFPVFAKETGRDTSHIYTYIEHIGMECSKHLLAWLRYKCMYPTQKTEVVPVIISRTQGNGKTTFAEVICKGLFGEENVIVTDQYDANSRFNADYADALVICTEEKEENDKRSTSAALKSRSTGSTIRKEYKGLDPTYQENYSEFIVTTNKDVPIKFDGNEEQRRFMVMESDPDFTRKYSLADTVFTKLYGQDALGTKYGLPFVKDTALIQQFKHELYSDKELAGINLHDFPKTAAYERCKNMPRTNEVIEVDSILRSLAPFIKQSLLENRLVTQIRIDADTVISLAQITNTTGAFQIMPEYNGDPAYLAICRPIIFFDQQTGRPLSHAVVERSIIDCTTWLLTDYGLRLLPSQLPLDGGFRGIENRYRAAPAARFSLADECTISTKMLDLSGFAKPKEIVTEPRIGERLRVNKQWQPDPNGEYETVNEMKPGTTSLKDKTNNVQYMDTFLFEADDTDKLTYNIEMGRLRGGGRKYAASLFNERLRLQKHEANRLVDQSIAFRVVYSGGKSYHILVRVKDAPTTLDEYKWLHAHLCDGVISTKLDFDTTCNDPARLTRAPIQHERTFMYDGVEVLGTQLLVREEPGQVFNYNWRPLYQQWLNRPPEVYEQLGRKLRPAKKEYKDAMEALLRGTFWTDNVWHGKRQVCFFPAYRLCRLLGYSHEQLWAADGILDGLQSYYRKGEISYWKSREQCSLITEIDLDVDRQLEEEGAYAGGN